MNLTALAGAAGVLSCVAIAGAQPLVFEIDQSQSTIDLVIEIDLGALGGDTDSDGSSLSGTIDSTLDDAIAPSEATLNDFSAMIDSDLMYNWVPAFLSTADASLTGGFVQYADPGVDIGPVPVVDGQLTFPAVPTLIGGVLNVNYNIFLFGSGSETIDLSTLEPSFNDISGVLSNDGSVVTVTNSIEFVASQPLIVDMTELGTVNVTGTVTMVATAEIPSCAPDLNGDGVLDFFDVSAFLTAFGNQDASADFNNDSAWDFFDVSAFLTAFGNGCP